MGVGRGSGVRVTSISPPHRSTRSSLTRPAPLPSPSSCRARRSSQSTTRPAATRARSAGRPPPCSSPASSTRSRWAGRQPDSRRRAPLPTPGRRRTRHGRCACGTRETCRRGRLGAGAATGCLGAGAATGCPGGRARSASSCCGASAASSSTRMRWSRRGPSSRCYSASRLSRPMSAEAAVTRASRTAYLGRCGTTPCCSDSRPQQLQQHQHQQQMRARPLPASAAAGWARNPPLLMCASLSHTYSSPLYRQPGVTQTQRRPCSPSQLPASTQQPPLPGGPRSGAGGAVGPAALLKWLRPAVPPPLACAEPLPSLPHRRSLRPRRRPPRPPTRRHSHPMRLCRLLVLRRQAAARQVLRPPLPM